MGIFDKVKKTSINSRRIEEKLYEVALDEVEKNNIRKGLYAKALSKAEGDKEKANGIYLKLRVQSIMDDIESERITNREDARVYAAMQELIEVKSEKKDSLFDECKKLLRNKGYTLKKSDSGEYTIERPGVLLLGGAAVVYSSKNLNNIKKEAYELADLSMGTNL